MAAREKAKYEHPVSSREMIMEHLEKRGEPLVFEQIAHDLEHQGEAELEGLRRRVSAMVRDGQLMRNRRGGFGLTSAMDMIQGRVQGHKDGFGFLIPDKGGDDLFLSAREMRKLMHGDRAMAVVSGVDRRGRLEGHIIEVLEHCTTSVAGRFFLENGISQVVPNQTKISQEIIIPEDGRNGASDGQMVVARITAYPEGHRPAVGIIERVLGDHMAPGMEIDVALHSFDLPHEWPTAVDEEAAVVPKRVPPKAKAGREDLRELPLITIDGEDARDFDDAVYCERDGKGWRLLVAIADVAHYVTPGSALDAEALNRGNSVYFPEQVIPMLPEVLSNGLCSINPKVDRLCMVCELKLGPRGKVNSWRFFEGVMRSRARLTYTKVAAIIDGDKRLRATYKSVLPYIEDLHELYGHLARRRQQRGAIDFDSTETRIVFGPDRKIESIVPVERNDAHRLIEECMIIANVAAGEFLVKHKIPGLFRVHAGPTGDKLIGLRDFLKEMGLELDGGDEPGPRDYARLLNSIKGRPEAQLIQTVMLRSLKQAVYTPENSGHFGLAVKAYSHFTSPIRRYPDLLLHRAVKHILHGGKGKDFRYSMDDMEQFGEHCSMTSRRADEAGWDVDAWLKAEYMLDKVGQQFTGIVTSVTSFGLFVQLQDVFVEGLVHVSSLNNDYYHFDPVRHRLSGERSGTIYALGTSIEVVVNRVDLEERRIDFALPKSDDDESDRPKRSRKSRHKRSRQDDRSDKRQNQQAGQHAPSPTESSAEHPAQSHVGEATAAVTADVAAAPPQESEPAAAREPAPAPEHASKPAPPPSQKQQSEQQSEQQPVQTEQSPTAAGLPVGAERRARPKKKRRSGRRGLRRDRGAGLPGQEQGGEERPALFDTRHQQPTPEETQQAGIIGQVIAAPAADISATIAADIGQTNKKPRRNKRSKTRRSEGGEVGSSDSVGNTWTEDGSVDDLPDEHLDQVFNGNVVSNTPEAQNARDGNRARGQSKSKRQGQKRAQSGNKSGNKSAKSSGKQSGSKARSGGNANAKSRSRRRKPQSKRGGNSDNSGNA